MVVKAKLYDQDVGVLTSQNGGYFFQYFDTFVKSGLEISPFYLSLSNRVYSGREFLAFEMIPGVFHDSLPDSFGSALMAAYFKKHEHSFDAMRDPLRKLSYMGERSIGAIEYEPILVENSADRQSIDLKSYIESVREVIEGSSEEVTRELTAHPSPGGARPKAFVNWDRQTDHLMVGREMLNMEQWIVKFSENSPLYSELTKIEYVYFQIAQDIGLKIPEFDMIAYDDAFHFAVKRFDRKDGEKYHLHTLSGLLNTRFEERGLISYEDLLKVTLRLTHNMQDVIEAYKRMVFNILAKNCDDHAKNFSYLMDRDGRWSLSPAYDLIYSSGSGVYGEHFLSLSGKRKEITESDMITLASQYDIDAKRAKEIIEATRDALSSFEKYAKEVGIDADVMLTIERDLG